MKNKLLLTIIFALLFNYLYATPQIRDRVFWNGLECHSIPSVKLEEHFSEQEVMRLNQLSNEWNVTSNYRGYWFEFEIENDSLYLKGIVNDDEENIMESIIGTSDRKWMCHYSDTMYLGYDESMFDDAFWTMIYESEMTVVFKDGIVQWVKDNQSKSKYSQYDHNVLLFSEFIYCNTRWDELDSKTLQEKPVVYLRYDIDTLGKIGEIKVLKSSGYAAFDKEAIRVIRSIPGFSVSFVKGKYIPHSYNFSYIFDLEKAKKNGSYSKQKQYDNQLLILLEESIMETKNKYDSLSKKVARNHPLYLCSDGIPSPSFEQNKPFYNNIGIENLSWHSVGKYLSDLKKGIDVLEIRYYLKGNIIEFYVHIVTAKEQAGEVSLSHWFEDVDKYVYEYSCETNEWQLIKKE